MGDGLRVSEISFSECPPSVLLRLLLQGHFQLHVGVLFLCLLLLGIVLVVGRRCGKMWRENVVVVGCCVQAVVHLALYMNQGSDSILIGCVLLIPINAVNILILCKPGDDLGIAFQTDNYFIAFSKNRIC